LKSSPSSAVSSHPVEVHHLRREYEIGEGRRRKKSVLVALDDVVLSLERGEILGLLGPNGAGKTTLVKILSTVLLPTSGTARVLGHDVVREAKFVRPLIGIVFGGERGLYQRLTARQNLLYWSALYKIETEAATKRVNLLLERVGLNDRADSFVETFSRGMKQRLHLARGLVHDPPVLFLDEPTTGMDPVAARDFRVLVDDLRREGRTILLTTHNMAEAESVCDRVALIDRGRLLAIEPPRTLASWIAQFERIDVEDASDELLESIRALEGVSKVEALGDRAARIEVSSAESTKVVLKTLVDAGLVSVRTSLPTLEEVYLHVFGDRQMNI
jgi:ABC-2 type transport system ATP-binding protein